MHKSREAIDEQQVALTEMEAAEKGRRPWTQQDLDTLKRLYPDIRADKLAKQLGRSIRSIYQQAQLMGLKKSEAFHQSDDCGRIKKGVRNSPGSEFKKGSIPPNKGKKWSEYMPEESQRKILGTCFKKGHMPHNAQYDGYQAVDKYGYIKVRIELNKFEFLHRLVWEKQFGQVPKGYCVAFKDGNKQNCSIENLKLITRKENMLQNTLHRYPEDLQRLIMSKGALNRQINKLSKNNEQ